eukprot:jgi/Tetstr1/421611/TSEL_012552.t1
MWGTRGPPGQHTPRVARPWPAVLTAALCALLVVAAMGMMIEWRRAAGSSDAREGAGPAGFAMAAVLNAEWVPERVVRADNICSAVVTSAPCVRVPGPRVSDADETALVWAGYIEPFEPRAPTAVREWWASRLETPKHRLYQLEPSRVFRASSVGNLVGLWSILARWVAAGAGAALLPQAADRPAWLPPKEALRMQYAGAGSGGSILVLEDDANLLPGFERAVLGMLPELPENWDLLDLDPAPGLCDGGSWWRGHPKTRVFGSRYRLHRSHVAFTRTTAVVYSEKGARTILRHLPTSLVVDLYVAKLLRLGILSVYVSCDGLLVQSESDLGQVQV